MAAEIQSYKQRDRRVLQPLETTESSNMDDRWKVGGLTCKFLEWWAWENRGQEHVKKLTSAIFSGFAGTNLSFKSDGTFSDDNRNRLEPQPTDGLLSVFPHLSPFRTVVEGWPGSKFAGPCRSEIVTNRCSSREFEAFSPCTFKHTQS